MDMNKQLEKRILSVLIIISLIFALTPGDNSVYADDNDLDNYVMELSKLVQSTWDDDFLLTAEFRLDEPEMTVNGETLEIDPEHSAAPYLSEEGDAMLPVHLLSELFDVDVAYDDQTGGISIISADVEVQLKRGSRLMSVNDNYAHLESAPEITDDTIFIPARAVAEQLLCEVDYIPEGGRVVLTKPFQTKRLIVKTDGTPLGVLNQIDGVTHTLSGPDNTYILQFDSEMAAKAAMETLEPIAEYCEPDLVLTVDYQSWGVEYIGADKYISYLSYAESLPSVTVAVLDTGVDDSHPLLTDRVIAGRNIINSSNNTNDTDGHGTHIAGIISDSTPENVKIMPIKVLSNRNISTVTIIDAGIRYAANNGADVINMSIGGPGTSQSTRNAIIYANNSNAVVIAAAGNENDDASKYIPANVPEAITVAACDNRNRKASFSNYGNLIDVSAPGVGITSSAPGGGYATLSGTSMAAPYVSAAVALLKSDPRYSDLNPAAIKTKIQSLTDDAGEVGFDIYFGYGILNLAKAEIAITHAEMPVITVHPQDTEIMQGTTHTLSVTAQSTDDGGLSYQWYRNTGSAWAVISDATSPTYSVPSDMAGVYDFFVLVTNTNNDAYGNKTASIASNAATVTVKAIPIEPTARLTVKAPAFSEVVYLYTQPDAMALTITNIGNSPAAISSVTISDASAFDVISGDAAVPPGSSNSSWKIRPKVGLVTGLYTAIATVAYDSGATASIDVSFTVRKATPTISTAPTASNVSAGNKLSTSVLSGGAASTGGTLAWTTPDVVVNTSSLFDVIFTPADTFNFETVILQVAVTVNTGSNSNGGSSSTSGSTGGGGGGGGSGSVVVGAGTSFIVTFDTNGGNVIEGQSIAYNGKVAKPSDPQKDNFVFAGWYSDKELTKVFDFNMLIKSNTTLYAKWTGNTQGPMSVLMEGENLFTDVRISDWFYGDVEYVYANNLFAGTSATAFSPNTPMTRAMLVTVLWRMEGSPAESGSYFTDVASGQWYSDAVAWAAVNGIVSGIGGGLFAPNAEITRQDMAVMLLRYLNFIKLDYLITEEYRIFADESEISDYAKNAVQVLNKLNVINGKGNNIIDPKGRATRAEAAAMLRRIMEFIGVSP